MALQQFLVVVQTAILVLCVGLTAVGLWQFGYGQPFVTVRAARQLRRLPAPTPDQIRLIGLSQAFIGFGLGLVIAMTLMFSGFLSSIPRTPMLRAAVFVVLLAVTALALLSFAGAAIAGSRGGWSKSIELAEGEESQPGLPKTTN